MKIFINILVSLVLMASVFGFTSSANAQSGKIFMPHVSKPAYVSLVPNGSFEQGYTAWSWYPGGAMITPVYAQQGAYSALLGDGTHNRSAYIQQQVVVPVDKTYLAFYKLMNSADACSPTMYMWDYLVVTVNGDVMFYESVCADNSNANWMRVSINLAGYAGQVVNLTVQFTSDESISSWLYFDNFDFKTY